MGAIVVILMQTQIIVTFVNVCQEIIVLQFQVTQYVMGLSVLEDVALNLVLFAVKVVISVLPLQGTAQIILKTCLKRLV